MAHRKDSACSVTVRNKGLHPFFPCLHKTPAFFFSPFPTEYMYEILLHKYPQKNVLLGKLELRHSGKLLLNPDNKKHILKVQKSRKKQ